jgi:RNA polymerase sigma-70 factor (ECF subfamily)
MVEQTVNITDELLLTKFVSGDTNAFDELINRYYKPIFRFLVRFTGRQHLAEDLIQDVFIKVYKSADTFDPTRRFRPWLYQIAANRARDAIRSAGRSEKQLTLVDSEDHELTLDHLATDDSPSPDCELIRRETTEKVKDALMAIPEQLREILILAYYDKLPYKDISDTLGIPLGTVKSRLHKAVATFGEVWKRYEPDTAR